MATPVKRWRSSAADTIDDDLAALWRELAREAPVSRAVMSNLVVYCRRAAGDDVIRRHRRKACPSTTWPVIIPRV